MATKTFNDPFRFPGEMENDPFRFLEQAGFRHRADEVYPTDQIRRAKPGLRQAGDVPLALLFDCVADCRLPTAASS